MLWNVTLPLLFFLISSSHSGKATAKRGSRQDSGKLVATLCHYYSDGAMGCKECFEVARTHRSNHNSTLLPPCKSVQGIKRRNWTLDDGIIINAVIDSNATKRLTIASCAFYANKTFTCVATRPQCENLTQSECANSTSWSSRFEGSITEGFRCLGPHGSKSATTTRVTAFKFSSSPNTTPLPVGSSAATSTNTATTTFPAKRLTTANTATTSVSPGTSVGPNHHHPAVALPRNNTMMTFGQVSDTANEIHKIPILEMTTAATTPRETKPPLTLDYGATTPYYKQHTGFTLTLSSRVPAGGGMSSSTVQPPLIVLALGTVSPSAGSTEYTENCTETSCTIFVENNLQSNGTAASNTTQLRSVGGNATGSSGETLITLSPIVTSTRAGNQTVPHEELVTLTSHLHDSSTVSPSITAGITAATIASTTSTPTTATTLAVVGHTLLTNRTMPTLRPEPRHPEHRKRHSVRRMY
ncbi:hypothetical protein BV898_01662 [Hypsibius exemplaris]|uniref:Uncharacterized protein n=1 Tax=Hypsibius exemplaris TaxID=2072580 RepID=A0A1W0XBB5_HYPEX|nr:hypothetical protein BV898_01662 [Hypsibius exemplaris]